MITPRYAASGVVSLTKIWSLFDLDSEISREAIGVGQTDSDHPKVCYLNSIASGVVSLTIISVKIREVDIRYLGLGNYKLRHLRYTVSYMTGKYLVS